MSQKIVKITAAMKQIKIKERLLKYGQVIKKKLKTHGMNVIQLTYQFHYMIPADRH